MKNQFVPYQIAKTLKEKGFDEECRFHYDVEFKECTWNIEFEPLKNSEIIRGYYKLTYPMISAPTYQQAIDWLETKGIYVIPDLIILISTPIEWIGRVKIVNGYHLDIVYSSNPFQNKYEALTSAIEEALKLVH